MTRIYPSHGQSVPCAHMDEIIKYFLTGIGQMLSITQVTGYYHMKIIQQQMICKHIYIIKQ